MSVKNCLSKIEDDLDSLIDYHANEILDDSVFVHTLLNVDLLNSLDEFIKSMDSNVVSFPSIKFIITGSIRNKNDEKIEMYSDSKLLNNLEINLDTGYVMFINISGKRNRFSKELVIFHFDDNSKYILEERINKGYILTEVDNFNLEDYINSDIKDIKISKSRFKISYSTVYDYVQLFKNMYNVLKYKYGKVDLDSKCPKFSKLLDRFISHFNDNYNLQLDKLPSNVKSIDNYQDPRMNDMIRRDNIYRDKRMNRFDIEYISPTYRNSCSYKLNTVESRVEKSNNRTRSTLVTKLDETNIRKRRCGYRYVDGEFISESDEY